MNGINKSGFPYYLTLKQKILRLKYLYFYTYLWPKFWYVIWKVNEIRIREIIVGVDL